MILAGASNRISASAPGALRFPLRLAVASQSINQKNDHEISQPCLILSRYN